MTQMSFGPKPYSSLTSLMNQVSDAASSLAFAKLPMPRFRVMSEHLPSSVDVVHNSSAIPMYSINSWVAVDDTSAVSVVPDQSTFLEQLYIFRNRLDVRSFLDDYPFLISLLHEAYNQINYYFQNPQIFLEVLFDPEDLEDNQLVASISINCDSDDAFDRLNDFDQDWWIHAVGRSRGKLCINIEFQ